MTMKPLVFALSGLLLSLTMLGSPTPALARDSFPAAALAALRSNPQYAPGRILVKFKNTRPLPSAGPRSMAAPMGKLELNPAAQAALARIEGQVEQTYANLGVVRVATRQDVGRAIEALYRSGSVVYAEPDYRVHAARLPNDPDFHQLWGLHNTGQSGGTADADIDAPAAWDTRSAAYGVVVGVLDSGVDYTHPDLVANMWTNPNEIPGNGIDDDNNGYVDDIHGIDRYNADSDPMDDNGHGTHVSGTIGARGNDGNGIAGVAWRVQIMALKFLDSDTYGYASEAVALINYAIAIKAANQYPAMILNNSWGGSDYLRTLDDAIKAAGDAGILFVAAAGNDGVDTDVHSDYPSSYAQPNIISVGASDHDDQPAGFSNRGCASVDLFAPGVDIYSTLPGNGYASWSGTSMAAPHVAGAAALIWAQFPNKTWKDIKRAILNGADAQAEHLNDLAGSEARLNVQGGMRLAYMNQPSIWGLSGTIAAPGGKVTITGSNFGKSPGTVLFNGSPLNVGSWANERIVASVPDGMLLGDGLLKVQNASGVRNRNGHCFKVGYTPSLAGRTLLPHAYAAGAKVGSDYWILGGATHWGATALVERYTPSTGRRVIDSGWMLPDTAVFLTGGAIGGKIYVPGGLDWTSGQMSDALRIFDTATGTWSQGARLPVRMIQPAVAGLPNGKFYVFGGLDENNVTLDTTYIYDPVANSWSTGAPMPTPQAWGAPIVQGGNNVVWIAGGYGSHLVGSELDTVQVYNADHDSWSTRPALNAPRTGAAGMYYKNRNHVLFGSNVTGLRDGEWFSGGTWIDAIMGPQSVHSVVGGATFDAAYSFGGINDPYWELSDSIWKLSH